MASPGVHLSRSGALLLLLPLLLLLLTPLLFAEAEAEAEAEGGASLIGLLIFAMRRPRRPCGSA